MGERDVKTQRPPDRTSGARVPVRVVPLPRLPQRHFSEPASCLPSPGALGPESQITYSRARQGLSQQKPEHRSGWD